MIQKEDYLVFWTWTVEWMLLELLHYLVQMWWFKEYWKKFGKKTEESEHNERYAQSKINTIRIERF